MDDGQCGYIAKLERKLHIEKKNLATSVTMKGGEFQIVFFLENFMKDCLLQVGVG